MELHNHFLEKKKTFKKFNEKTFEYGFTKLEKSGDGKISFDEAF